jgi:hypothetical protein
MVQSRQIARQADGYRHYPCYGDEPEKQASTKVAVYARVSSAENKSNLDSQAERLVAYCATRGYPVAKVVKEVGSGINDSPPKFLALLAEQRIGMIVVEHKDRAIRFGFRSIETMKPTDARYQAIDQGALASKNLYNAANYEMRQSFIHQGPSLNYEEIYARMKSDEAYKALPAKVSQQVLRVLDKNWSSFSQSLKA